MTLPRYPDSLPPPERTNYALAHTGNYMVTDMEFGPARKRLIATSTPSAATVQWLFKSDVEAAAFEAWVRDVLNYGMLPFEAPFASPIGIKYFECEFVTSPPYSGPVLDRCWWRISARLRIAERPMLPAGYGLIDPAILLLAGSLGRVVNQILPEA